MVDVDKRPNRGHSVEHRAEAALDRVVQRHNHVKRARTGIGRNDQLVARQVAVFLRNTIFVPSRDRFAKTTEPEREGEGRPQCVAVGSHMARNKNAVRALNGRRDLGKGRVHFVSSKPRSSRILIMRDPRSMESSSLKLRCGVCFSTTRLETSV